MGRCNHVHWNFYGRNNRQKYGQTNSGRRIKGLCQLIPFNQKRGWTGKDLWFIAWSDQQPNFHGVPITSQPQMQPNTAGSYSTAQHLFVCNYMQFLRFFV